MRPWDPITRPSPSADQKINKRKVKTGTFLGLDELGGLIVGENSGVKKIYSGDVYFGS